MVEFKMKRTEPLYMDIVKHYENCFKKYGDNNRGVDWPNKEDTQKRYKVMLDLIKYDSKKENGRDFSLLDFGCGLGHLYEYMLKNNYTYYYEGLDLSQSFIEICKKKYPKVSFIQQDVLSENWEIDKTWDYICINGVFTEKRNLSYNEMLNYFEKMLKTIYAKCNRGIAFNVMSKDVDWEREDLFHLPLNELSSFLTKELSRNFIIRNDYGLYEYTTYLYK